MTEALTLGSYDLLLALLPVPLLVAYVLGTLSAVAMAPALTIGSALSSIPLSYTLFVEPPTEPSA